MKPVIDLFTDGSCPVPQGPGGWAFILRIRGTTHELRHSGGEKSTTNNRMELMGVIEGLKRIPLQCEVHIVSDSQYVIFGIDKWRYNWKKNNWQKKNYETGALEPIMNPDLWKELDALLQHHIIHAKWVKGHKGHPENEACDVAAGLETKKFLEQIKAEAAT